MFPAVMAIEAMVEAAMACAGRDDLPVLRNLRFHRPVIVPGDSTVPVRTLAMAHPRGDNEMRIRVAIRTDGDRPGKIHSEAECVFGLAGPVAAELATLPQLPETLETHPEDLSPVPLFQGKFFRRIAAIRKLEMGKESLTEVRVPEGERYFSDDYEQLTVTRSPVARDAFLQSGAAILPPGCLPVRIGEIRFHRSAGSRSRLLCRSLVKTRSASEIVTDISVFTPDGEPVETITDLVLRLPKAGTRAAPRRGIPPIPLSRLGADLRALLTDRLHALEVVDHRTLENLEPSKDLSRAELQYIRSEVPRPRQPATLASHLAARRAAGQFASRHLQLRLCPDQMSVEHTSHGKPRLRFDDPAVARAFRGTDVTLTHGTGVSIALVGPAPVGLHIQSVEARDAETWLALLGADGYDLALRVTEETAESFDAASTRVWALLEAGKKTNSPGRVVPDYEAPLGGPWSSFSAVVDDAVRDLLCVTLRLPGESRAPPAVLAVTMGVHRTPVRGRHSV